MIDASSFMCFGYLLDTVVCYDPVVWSSRYFDNSFFFLIWLKLPICWFCSTCWITTYSYSNNCEQSLFQKSLSSSFYQAWMYRILCVLYSCWICLCYFSYYMLHFTELNISWIVNFSVSDGDSIPMEASLNWRPHLEINIHVTQSLHSYYCLVCALGSKWLPNTSAIYLSTNMILHYLQLSCVKTILWYRKSMCRMSWKLGFGGFPFGFHGMEVLSCGLTSTNGGITSPLEMLYSPRLGIFMFVSSKMSNENVNLCAHDK